MSGSREHSGPGDARSGAGSGARKDSGSPVAERPRADSAGSVAERLPEGSAEVVRSPESVVGIVGAGTMGAGIAQVAALAGAQVYVHDIDPDRLAAAAESVRRRMRRLAETDRIPDADAVLGRIRFCDGVSALSGATLVIEAAVESLAVKVAILRELEGHVAPTCVLASNTSSLSITALAAALQHPGRCCGMHFFNPATALPLVEVISGAQTEPATLDRVEAAARAWGKTPIRCASSPGFLVNRAARPFYGEAQRLVEEGAADPSTVDRILAGAAGFAMGPFALTDLVGQDVSLAVATSMWQDTFHDPRYAPTRFQQDLVDSGRLGRKSGRGVYEYGEQVGSVGSGAQQVRSVGSGEGQVGSAVAPGSGQVGPAAAPRSAVAPGSGQVGPAVAPGSRQAPSATASGAQRVTPAAPPREPLTITPSDLPCGARLQVTDGRTATEMAAELGRPVVLLDLVGERPGLVAGALSDGAPEAAEAEAAAVIGRELVLIDDVPGLVVARTVAMLVNEAVDLVARGVATPSDVDRAMRLGVNYPLGPLEWGDRIGAPAVVAILDRLHAAYPTGRYRVSPRLRRAAISGQRLTKLVQ